MALVDIFNAYTNKDDDFRKQVAGACLIAARDICAEDPGTTNHAGRIAWAAAVLQNPEGKAIEILPRVLANATVSASMPAAVDSDVQFVVNSLVDSVAG